jgi:hypothetical protein
MHTYQVNFSKRFVDGPFKGRLYHSYLRFADWKTADAFRIKCEYGAVFEPCAGVSAYKAEDVILTAIEPMPA